MSDKWRRVRVTGDQDGGGRGKWFAAWVWAAIKLVTHYAG